MLTELTIKNLAIIDDMTVSFEDGLNVLTGETGAGKSIIINAVNLILGMRATSKWIRTGEANAEIEASFTVTPGTAVARLMESHELSPEDGLVIRRVISDKDRHKIYINGRMGTIQMLADITQNLASISGQHANQGLLREETHLDLLDQFGNLFALREKVKTLYGDLVPLLASLRKYRDMEQKQAQHLEFLQFQKNDIEKAALRPREDEELEEKRNRLRYGEALSQTVHQTLEELYTMDGAVFERLSGLQAGLDKAAALDPELGKLASDMTDLVYKIEDMAGALRDYGETISTDSSLLEETESRLDFLTKFKRKYAGPGGSLADVEALYQSIVKDLAEVENIGTVIKDLETAIGEKQSELLGQARDLSEKRSRTASRLSSLVEKELAGLDMKKTRFEVRVEPVPADGNTPEWLKDGENVLTETGLDRAMFMISPNVGEEMKPLSKIASGGELSRVVLALKAILAGVDSVSTIVFDEVDAGIGGGVAEKVGEKIKALSAHHQVICITHLPQIAKFGDVHFKIEKSVVKGRTRTGIVPLTGDQRVDELARMLGGQTITPATLAHAREMLADTP